MDFLQIALKNLVIEVTSTGVLANGRPLKMPAQIDRLAISSMGQYYTVAGLGGKTLFPFEKGWPLARNVSIC